MPRKFAKSFEYAFAGLHYIFTTQRNMRIHIIAALGAIGLSLLLRLSLVEFAVVFLACFLVMITEMLNTAIEEAINLLYKQHDLHAQLAKDVSAAATLFAGICAIIIGGLVLLPKIMILFAF
jgi:diacylglycerol kinase (ATP)